MTLPLQITRCFPGVVYDAGGISLTPGAPSLTQKRIDRWRVRSMVSVDGEQPPGRIWFLDADATFDAIPAPERYAALAILRGGRSILLIGDSKAAEANVRTGLLDLLDADEKTSPCPRSGHG